MCVTSPLGVRTCCTSWNGCPVVAICVGAIALAVVVCMVAVPDVGFVMIIFGVGVAIVAIGGACTTGCAICCETTAGAA